MDNYWIRRAQTGAVHRRRFLGGATAIGAGTAGLALVGCGGDDAKPAATATVATGGTTATGSATAASSPAAAVPKKGGEVVFTVGAPQAQSIDPHTTLNLGMFYWGIIANKLIDNDHKKIEPLQGELIEKWEQVDKTTLVLTVRQGVKWHEGHNTNGRAFKASDVVYNLMRIAGRLPEDATRKAQFQRQTLLDGMDTATAIDDKTVRVTFTSPRSQFLQGLADWRQWIVAKEAIDKDPAFKDGKQWAGTGAFMVDSWDSTQNIGKYVANPSYWKAGKPYLASVSQVVSPDAATGQSLFLSGKTSYLAAMSEQERNLIIKGRPEAKIMNWPHTGWEYARMNQTRDPFKDPRVRKAVFLTLNYKDLLEANYGKGDFWDFTGPLVSGFPGTWTSDDLAKMAGWNPNSKPQDLAEAKKLFDAAGVDPSKFSFALHPGGTAGYWFDNAVRTKDQFDKAWPGSKTTIYPVADGAELVRNLNSGTFDMMFYGSFPSPSAVLEGATTYGTGGGRNYTKFSDPDVDRLIASAVGEFDAAARSKVMGELQAKLMESIFICPIGKRRSVFARQANIQGFEDWAGLGTFEYYNQAFSTDSVWIA